MGFCHSESMSTDIARGWEACDLGQEYTTCVEQFTVDDNDGHLAVVDQDTIAWTTLPPALNLN